MTDIQKANVIRLREAGVLPGRDRRGGGVKRPNRRRGEGLISRNASHGVPFGASFRYTVNKRICKTAKQVEKGALCRRL